MTRHQKDSLIVVYLAFGIVALIVFVFFRFRRKGGSWLLTFLFAHELMLILYAMLWPVFLPLFLWSLTRRDRDQKASEITTSTTKQ